MMALIEHFVKVSLGSDNDAYARGYQLPLLLTPICKHPKIVLQLSHIRPVSRIHGGLIAIQAHRIIHKCIFIIVPNKQLDTVCQQLNMFEYCA